MIKLEYILYRTPEVTGTEFTWSVPAHKKMLLGIVTEGFMASAVTEHVIKHLTLYDSLIDTRTLHHAKSKLRKHHMPFRHISHGTINILLVPHKTT